MNDSVNLSNTIKERLIGFFPLCRMSYTWNLDNDLSIKLASVTHYEDIIFFRPNILGILALIIKFDLQIRFVIHISMILVCEFREFFFEVLTF